ncbi:hypothetical protein WAI453_008049 [Rhynchosporium graminicola]
MSHRPVLMNPVIALAIKYRPDLPATSNRNLSSYPSPHSLSGPTRRAREHCPRDTFSDQSSSQEHDLNRPRRLRRKKADGFLAPTKLTNHVNLMT